MDMTRRQRDVIFFKRNKAVLKWVAIIGGLITLLIFTFFIRIDLFNRPELIQQLLERTGIMAPVVYFILSIGNTIYPLIPGGLGNVIGYTVFGAVHGMALAFAANFIGSLLLFYITKRFGRPILYAFFEEKMVKKSLSYLDRGVNMNWVIAFVFIVPGLPDDLFTMVAGLSGMAYRCIIILQLLFKPVTMFLYMAGINNLFVLLSEWF